MYLEKYDQDSYITYGIQENTSQQPTQFETSYFLNYARGLFSVNDSKIKGEKRFWMEWHHDNVYKIPLRRPKSYWRMRIMLIPISKGDYFLNEKFLIKSKEVFFDGIQTYLLSPP